MPAIEESKVIMVGGMAPVSVSSHDGRIHTVELALWHPCDVETVLGEVQMAATAMAVAMNSICWAHTAQISSRTECAKRRRWCWVNSDDKCGLMMLVPLMGTHPLGVVVATALYLCLQWCG